MFLKFQELAKRIEQAGMSHAKFAEICGISRQAITAWVSGVRNPKPVNVRIMADALGCSIADIADITDCEAPLEITRHKDTASQIIAGQELYYEQQPNDDLTQSVYKYIAFQIAAQVDNTSQSEVGRTTGLSASQINRIIHGKADLSLFPLGALMKLCPQIINYDVVRPKKDNELGDVIARIKLLVDRIADTHTAKTVESMLKGLIERDG